MSWPKTMATKISHKVKEYQNPSPPYLGNISIKHDLARSCFQFWPKISNEGDKIEIKTPKALVENSFSQNFPKQQHFPKFP